MNKIIFNIIDTTFSHDKYAVAGKESKHIVWDRNLTDTTRPTFYSHNKMLGTKNLTSKNNSFGIIFESKAIIPFVYKQIEKEIVNFKKVFTHNSIFLEKYENCFWIPGGGIWIGGSYGGGEIKIHPKNKLCSIVSSSKKMCVLHNFRLGSVDLISRKYQNKVDIFGIKKWCKIHESLNDYMFSIVIENYQDDLYFTEKILNCFATGTIPIYLGARKISDIFNENGIIRFNDLTELDTILSTLNTKMYWDRIDAINDNFNRCQKFDNIEDYIFENYFDGK